MPNIGWPYNQNMSYQQSNTNNIIQQPVNNMLQVMGPESAKAYSLPTNSKVVLFDASNPIFYFKATDENGFISAFKIYKFEEIDMSEAQFLSSEQNDTLNFATKEDLEALQNNISELKDMLKGLVD